jgi:hypothetical protein
MVVTGLQQCTKKICKLLRTFEKCQAGIVWDSTPDIMWKHWDARPSVGINYCQLCLPLKRLADWVVSVHDNPQDWEMMWNDSSYVVLSLFWPKYHQNGSFNLIKPHVSFPSATTIQFSPFSNPSWGSSPVALVVVDPRDTWPPKVWQKWRTCAAIGDLPWVSKQKYTDLLT